MMQNGCHNRFQNREVEVSMDERLGALKLYRRHLVEQYSDRCAFWSLKDISGEVMSRTVCMCTDGADQAKYMVPRDPGLQTAYRSAKLHRPRLKIHGIWAFGYCLRIAVLDESTYHGSAMVVEMISLAIEDVMRISKERGQPPPHTCVVVGDNTVKELKNTYCLTAMANLCLHHKFQHLWL